MSDQELIQQLRVALVSHAKTIERLRSELNDALAEIDILKLLLQVDVVRGNGDMRGRAPLALNGR